MTSAEEWLRIESLDLEAQGVAHNGEGKVVFVEDALPGEEVRVAVQAAQEQLGAGDAGRAAPRERAARRAALPALRRLRRLQDAAPRRRRAGRDQAARARGRALASRQGPPRARPAADARARLELPAARAALGAPRRQEGHGPGRLPRAQVELRRRDQELRRPAAPRQRPDHAAARADRGDGGARPPAADRARGRRPRHRARPAPPRAAGRRATSRCCASSRAGTASSGGCSRKAPRPRIRSTARLRRSPTGCPSSACACRSGPPTSPRSTTQINEALVSRALRLLAPAADEFVIDWFCGLGNFTLPLATPRRPRPRHRRAARRCSSGRARRRRSTAWPRRRASPRATCSRSAPTI